ncbi:MAG: hypothetical protein JW772_02915 [Candidatus Diapherotrites archaeon]|nr:hypothetical protein [Candidatus Diapherotrites archaeon]
MTQETYNLFEKKLTTFASQMIEAYEKTNILNEFCTIKKFENQTNEFFQIAKRVGLPKEFFVEQDNVDNSMIASDFTKDIVIGEQNFVLKTILESKQTPRHIANSFDYNEFAKIIAQMSNPTNIFIPIEPYFKPLYKWAFANREQIKFAPGREPSLLIGGKEIQIHWVTSDTKINEIVVVDKNRLEIIQKKFEQSKTPKEINPITQFAHYSNNKKLMLYFAERDPDKFDFVFRSVISKPELTKESATIINVENKPREDK